MKVSIIGATGYGGAELVRILHRHPHVTIHSIHATSMHGENLSTVFPHMKNIIYEKLEDIDINKLADEVDVVFTATPSGVAKNLAPTLIEKNVKVIDLSGDFRIKNKSNYEQWYKIESADEHYMQKALYGLSELIDDDLTNKQLIANPGCFPTAILLGLAPLVKEKMIEENMIIIDAKTGISGAGKSASTNTHFPEAVENLKIYKVHEHQHTPEIEEQLQTWNENIGPITFTTHLVPMSRGIMATMYVTAKEKTSSESIIQLYEQYYNEHPFIRVHTDNFPSTKQVAGSNYCDISVKYDDRTNRITIVSVIDNLIKGASGQAVQNMNKMFGWKEQTGLDFMPLYP